MFITSYQTLKNRVLFGLKDYYLQYVSKDIPRKDILEKTDDSTVFSLEIKLMSLGFIHKSISDLERIVQNTEMGSKKRAAGRLMALWYLNNDGKGNKLECLKALALAVEGENDSDLLLKKAIMESECLAFLGDRDAAKKVIAGSLTYGHSTDALLAAANLELDSTERLGWINKAFALNGISPISIDQHKDLLAFDALAVHPFPGKNFKQGIKAPKVSVIMPAYNSGQYIATALKSLIFQSWANLEVIVVDDGSSDDTLSIVENYRKQDSRIIIIAKSKNRGPYVARNEGLTRATGEFVCCHDADEWSHPEKIAVQATHLNKNPLVVANTSEQAGATDDLRFIRRKNYGELIFRNHSSLMFRRRWVLDRLGCWDNVRFGADQELINRVVRLFGDAVVNLRTGPLSIVRLSPESLTSSKYGTSGFFMGARREYKEAQRYFYKSATCSQYDYTKTKRPFPVPEPMWPEREIVDGESRHFDLVIGADFRCSGEEIKFLSEMIKTHRLLSLKTGLVQLSKYDLDPGKEIKPVIRSLIEYDRVQMLVYGEKIDCDILMLQDLWAVGEQQHYLPVVKAGLIISLNAFYGVHELFSSGPHSLRLTYAEQIEQLLKDKDNDYQFRDILERIETVPTVADSFGRLCDRFNNSYRRAETEPEHTIRHDIQQLNAWLRKLDKQVNNMLKSSSWKVGNKVEVLLGLLTGRRKGYKPVQIIKKALKEYRKLDTAVINTEVNIEQVYQLNLWLEEIKYNFSLIKNVYHYRFVNSLVSCLKIFIPGKNSSDQGASIIQAVFAEYEDWLNDKAEKLISTDVDGKEGLFYRKLQKVLTDISDHQLNLQVYLSEAGLGSLKKEFIDSEQAEALVSIIMPTHNRAYIIGEAIQSIIEQNYSNWELIISDDGSNDGTQGIINKYLADKRISYHYFNVKGGPAKARNRVLSKASGEIIAFLDTDNLWHPDYLKIMVRSLQDRKDCFCAFSRYLDVVIEDDNYYLKTSRKLKFDYEKLSRKNYIDLNSFIFKRELYDCLGGFCDALQRRVDWDMVLKYTFIQEPVYLNYFLVLYQRNEAWDQVTKIQSIEANSKRIILSNVAGYYREGLPLLSSGKKPHITIIADAKAGLTGYSKADHLACALAVDHEVQLIRIDGNRNDQNSQNEAELSADNAKLEIKTWQNSKLDLFSFDQMAEQILPKINGDIVYTISPHLTIYGLGLLANYHLGKALCLEMADLDSLSEVLNQNHRCHLYIKTNGGVDPDLIDPSNVKWSSIMNYFALQAPDLFTPCQALNAFYNYRGYCLRDVRAYNGNGRDREFIRQQWGLDKEKFIVLFCGDAAHKMLLEASWLLSQLNDSAWQVLVLDECRSADYTGIEKEFSGQLKVLNIDHSCSTELVGAADAIVFRPDRQVLANRYKLPPLLTSALSKKIPVIAYSLSDFTELGKGGYIWVVDYGNVKLLAELLKQICRDEKTRDKLVEKGHSLYNRHFSYHAAKTIFSLAYQGSISKQTGRLQVAEQFVSKYELIKKALS